MNQYPNKARCIDCGDLDEFDSPKPETKDCCKSMAHMKVCNKESCDGVEYKHTIHCGKCNTAMPYKNENKIIELNKAWLEDMEKWRKRHFEELISDLKGKIEELTRYGATKEVGNFWCYKADDIQALLDEYLK